MKNLVFMISVFWFIFLFSFSPISGQEKDSLTWYSRSKLLKIYKDAGYVLVREETFLPKDNIYFLQARKL